jgi:hypothetical protein
MATTTPNFGWAVPTSTDLVKDGAVAIETLGDSIDASLVDLKGGTTGQVLSKASNTDMDFTWVTDAAGDITGVTAGTGISGGGTSGTVTVTNSMATAITTAGDLIKGTGSGTFDRLGIGTTGQVLTVTAGAPAWATPAGGGGKVLQVVQGTYTAGSGGINISTTTLTDTNLTASITPAATSSKILVMVMQHALGYRAYPYSGSKFALLRGSTQIGSTIVSGTNSFQFFAESITGTGFGIQGWYAYTILDSPATTSSTTYKVQMAPVTTANSGIVQIAEGFQSNIILMEIGA